MSKKVIRLISKNFKSLVLTHNTKDIKSLAKSFDIENNLSLLKQTHVIDLCIIQKYSDSKIAEIVMMHTTHYDIKKAIARVKRHDKHDVERKIEKRLAILLTFEASRFKSAQKTIVNDVQDVQA
jgi:hypothetical protein